MNPKYEPMKYLSLLLMLLGGSVLTFAQPLVGRQNEVIELSFLSTRDYENPFGEIELDVEFVDDNGRKLLVPAFWAGGDWWKVRFSSPSSGKYGYRSICSDTTNEGLHGHAGTVAILPYGGRNELLRHGPVQINADKDIVHADGSPFLWLADSWWHGMTSRFRWPEDFQVLTQDRREKGFSVIQFTISCPPDVVEFDPRAANEAGFPTSRDYTRINPEYFEWVDRRIQHLVENGLMPNIVGAWGYYLPWFGVENMKRYWRYLIARYGAYPVSWTLAGETTLVYYLTPEAERETAQQQQKAGWSAVARYIQTNDPFDRILMVHPGPASGRFQPISEPSLVDMIMVQPGHRGWASFPNALRHLQTAQTTFPDQPVMQGEVCFEGIHGGGSDAKLQRLLFWTNMLSGAAGHCYGADAIWQFNTEEEAFGASPTGHIWGNIPWQEARHWQGAAFVGLGRKLLSAYPWQDFTSHPEWVSPAASEEDIMLAYAAGIPDGVRLFYFPNGLFPWGTQYRLLKLNPEKNYQAIFINPMTGDRYPITDHIVGAEEWTIPHAPILQDWLLEVRPVDTND